MSKTGIGDELIRDLSNIARAFDILALRLNAFFIISGDPTAERPSGVIKADDIISSAMKELNNEKDKDSWD